ncbi:amino acid permease [Schizosaccharomyces japonicus yFS275]|uniref:Amino acid permease n=1 Tax=Schizosaccharomyces japonicus (strain yFS275 / FY16936) TaxID=402676 RepID=B6K307_SCHJY|nr:amino acid permease [Schizosaccharomyces japonicus yFS275]EEB07864.1 amino acid permease [Schizosaccharomyces japonicus yFS275]
MPHAATDVSRPCSSSSSSKGNKEEVIIDEDVKLLKELNYEPILHRQFDWFDNFCAQFAALDNINTVRMTFTMGVHFAGPAAYWIAFLVSSVFASMTAATLAEVCSALPAAGSVYFWAAKAAGPKFGMLAAFLVAWWSATGWTTFAASNSQAITGYIFAEVNVFGGSYKTDVNDVHFRAVQWIVAEALLLICIILNQLSPKNYRWVFRIAFFFIIVDVLLNFIWLPISVSRSYGFRDAKFVFTAIRYPAEYLDAAKQHIVPHAWKWCLAYFASTGVLCGIDASGHVAEETRHASKSAAHGLFWSTVSTAVLAFGCVIMFLFCIPPDDMLEQTLYNESSTQPFVNMYALALGRKAHVFMNVWIIIEMIFNTSIGIVASSRLVFAIARDGVLPFSGWISKVSKDGLPRNAITAIYIIASLILCSILPSNMAFSSLISGGVTPGFAIYALINICRLLNLNPEMPAARWSVGIFSKPFQFCAIIYNIFAFAINVSPYAYPVTGKNFNYSCVIFGSVTIFAFLCWIFVPRDKWLTAVFERMRTV